MTKSSKVKIFHEYLLSDVFSSIGDIAAKPMFGGFGYYKEGTIFAFLTTDERIFFKVGEGNIKEYKDAGSTPFKYKMPRRKEMTMSYWELPADILENKEELIEWIEKSVLESKKSKKNK